MTMHILTGVMSGCPFCTFSGFLEDGMSGAIEALVFCNEVIDMARFYNKGIEVSTETLAEDVIDAVGPIGNFLGEEHTMRHFKEAWKPGIFTRSNYDNWDKKDLRQRCIEKVDEIVEAGPTTNRDPKMLEELDAIVNATKKHYNL